MPGRAAAAPTVCEINRKLLASSGPQDHAAVDRYSSKLGVSYPPLPWSAPEGLDSSAHHLPTVIVSGHAASPPLAATEAGSQERGEEGEDGAAPTPPPPRGLLQLARAGAAELAKRLLPGTAQPPKPPLLSWHHHRPRLAIAGANNRVLLYDLEETGPKAAAPGILSHEFQRGVAALAWRPAAACTLAVGCRAGVCLWTVNPRWPRGGEGGGPGTQNPQATMAFLQTRCHVTSLSWSPCGRLLATASADDPTVLIWDVATGVPTPLRRGLGGLGLVRWAPSGTHFVSTQGSEHFHLWETHTWTAERWSCSTGKVVSASWSPDGRVLLVGFRGASAIGAVHLAGRPPSLDAHLLPLELPQLPMPGEDAPVRAAGGVDGAAWDARGERLAVAFLTGEGLRAPQLALYDTRQSPIVAASLIGFIQPPQPDNIPLAFDFYGNLSQGSLLAVCWSGGSCLIYPLLFRS